MLNERTFNPASAAKLDDPARLAWLPPDEILDRLQIRSGMSVADIGAGTGYFVLPMAKRIPQGRIYAVDAQPEMLRILEGRIDEHTAAHIVLVQGTASSTTLGPASVDLVFLANIWHELDDHPAVLAECRRILRPDGHLAILDWDAAAMPPPGPPAAHRVPIDRVSKSLAEEGWQVSDASPAGSYTYLVLATKL